MRVSKGNRGGKSRQWGEREYAAPVKKERKTVRQTGTTTYRLLDPEWRLHKGVERLEFDAKCNNCGHHDPASVMAKDVRCVGCGLIVERGPTQ